MGLCSVFFLLRIALCFFHHFLAHHYALQVNTNQSLPRSSGADKSQARRVLSFLPMYQAGAAYFLMLQASCCLLLLWCCFLVVGSSELFLLIHILAHSYTNTNSFTFRNSQILTVTMAHLLYGQAKRYYVYWYWCVCVHVHKCVWLCVIF